MPNADIIYERIFTFAPPASSSFFDPEDVLDRCRFTLDSTPLFSSSAIAKTKLHQVHNTEVMTMIMKNAGISTNMSLMFQVIISTPRIIAGCVAKEQTLHQSSRACGCDLVDDRNKTGNVYQIYQLADLQNGGGGGGGLIREETQL